VIDEALERNKDYSPHIEENWKKLTISGKSLKRNIQLNGETLECDCSLIRWKTTVLLKAK
jgi:hypothetical protein